VKKFSQWDCGIVKENILEFSRNSALCARTSKIGVLHSYKGVKMLSRDNILPEVDKVLGTIVRVCCKKEPLNSNRMSVS